MSYPVLYVPAGDVVPIMFGSYDANGASVTLTGLAVTDIEIYKDGGTTQRASDAGYTLLDTDGIDFDGITGLHGFSIDTGDNTDAGFYTVGAWFTVVVSAVTIASQTVTFIAAMFRLMPAESIAGKPKVDVDAWLGTAAATPTVAGVPEVDVTHVAGSATTATLDTIKADTAAILTDTAEIGAAGAGLTALASQASVNTIDDFLDTEIAAILEDTGTTIPAQIAALNNLSAAQVNAEVDTALADYDAPTKAEMDTGFAGVADTVWDEAIEGSWTARKLKRLMAAVLLGKATGGSGTNAFRDVDDTKTRVSATVSNTGNRTAVSLDGD